MFELDQVLKSPYDFDNAMFFSIHVLVWQEGDVLDYGGTIENNTEHSVTINGAKYLKATCEFRIR